MAPSLVFSTSGGIVGQIADKHNQPYSRTLFWIKCKFFDLPSLIEEPIHLASAESRIPAKE